MSFFGDLLQKLQTKIMADIPQTDDAIGFRYVGQDFGQLNNDEVRPAVAFNCCLIDFATIDYQQKQLKAQWGAMNAISFKLGFAAFSSTNNLTPEASLEKALAYYELEEKFYLKFQDWTADGMLMIPLKRVSAFTQPRRDNIRVRNIIFKATYEDRSLALSLP